MREPPTIPKGPVLGWASFRSTRVPAAPSIADLPHSIVTSSGRAAIYQALKQLDLHPGDAVLVPSYHCPTMVAPVVLAGLQPIFYDIRKDGLPDLADIRIDAVRQPQAMIVAQYFGLPQSLQEARAWCDDQNIAMIEDCAHCYFGQAGDRPVGAWGDYSTASLTKFYPVPEGGLLASSRRPLRPLALQEQGARAQVKGVVDVLEIASQFQRMRGLNRVLAGLMRLKQGPAERQPKAARTQETSGPSMMEICDMGRIDQRALWISHRLWRGLPDGRILARRRSHFKLYDDMLADLPGRDELASLPRNPAAPYVYPVWVEDADRVYHGLRALNAPVFRWDRLWPDTPHARHPVSRRWSKHLLQLLCHQDLRDADIHYTVQCLKSLVAGSAEAASTKPNCLTST